VLYTTPIMLFIGNHPFAHGSKPPLRPRFELVKLYSGKNTYYDITTVLDDTYYMPISYVIT